MFAIKVETLDTQYTGVILAVAMVYFDPDKEFSIKDLTSSATLVKFNVKDQIQNYKRTTARSVISYWKEQPEHIKKLVFNPSPDDLLIKQAFEKISEYVNSHSNWQDIFWSKGYFSPVMFNAFSKVMDTHYIPYNNVRDIRTAIDLTKDTAKNGKCETSVDISELDYKNPIQACITDIMMLKYGV
jgi:hypothetical protein